MKIALINGSPKVKDSASGCFLDELKKTLPDCSFTEYSLAKPNVDLQSLTQQDAIVFAFPLYVDGVPSNMLHYLCQLETVFKNCESNAVIYAISNCGFFEAVQNRNALDIVKNWASKCGLKWGQGIGIGGGGMMLSIINVPAGKGPKKNISQVLLELSNHILNREFAENRFASPNIPGRLYKMAAQMGWRQQIKSNGLKRKDLNRQM